MDYSYKKQGLYLSNETSQYLASTKDFYFRSISFKILHAKTNKNKVGIKCKYILDSSKEQRSVGIMLNYSTERSKLKIQKYSKTNNSDHKIMFFMKNILKIIRTYYVKQQEFYDNRMKANLLNHYKKNSNQNSSKNINNLQNKFQTKSFSEPISLVNNSPSKINSPINCPDKKRLDNVFKEKDISGIIDNQKNGRLSENVVWTISNDYYENYNETVLDSFSFTSNEIQKQCFLEKSSNSQEILDSMINQIKDPNPFALTNQEKSHHIAKPKHIMIRNQISLKNVVTNKNYSKVSNYSEVNETTTKFAECNMINNSDTKNYNPGVQHNNKTLNKNYSYNCKNDPVYTKKKSLQESKILKQLGSVKDFTKNNLNPNQDVSIKLPETMNSNLNPVKTKASSNIYKTVQSHSTRNELPPNYRVASTTKKNNLIERSQSPITCTDKSLERQFKLANISNKLSNTYNSFEKKKPNNRLNISKSSNSTVYQIELDVLKNYCHKERLPLTSQNVNLKSYLNEGKKNKTAKLVDNRLKPSNPFNNSNFAVDFIKSPYQTGNGSSAPRKKYSNKNILRIYNKNERKTSKDNIELSQNKISMKKSSLVKFYRSDTRKQDKYTYNGKSIKWEDRSNGQENAQFEIVDERHSNYSSKDDITINTKDLAKTIQNNNTHNHLEPLPKNIKFDQKYAKSNYILDERNFECDTLNLAGNGFESNINTPKFDHAFDSKRKEHYLINNNKNQDYNGKKLKYCIKESDLQLVNQKLPKNLQKNNELSNTSRDKIFVSDKNTYVLPCNYLKNINNDLLKSYNIDESKVRNETKPYTKKGNIDNSQQYKLKSSVSFKKIQHTANGLILSSFTKDGENFKNSQINVINYKNKLNNENALYGNSKITCEPNLFESQLDAPNKISSITLAPLNHNIKRKSEANCKLPQSKKPKKKDFEKLNRILDEFESPYANVFREKEPTYRIKPTYKNEQNCINALKEKIGQPLRKFELKDKLNYNLRMK